MGKNKKENFIFTLICCGLMVLGMDSYNAILRNGFGNTFVKDVLISFLPVFCLALILDWFLVAKIAKSIVAKVVKHDDPLIKRILLISFSMVCGMCFCMSLITSIITFGISSEFPAQFAMTLGRNFIFALPLQLIIVGPIARTIFFKMYPAV
jgi:hypothetical protein